MEKDNQGGGHDVHALRRTCQKRRLRSCRGVTAEVDLDGGRAVVRAEQLPDDTALTSAVTEAGYKVVGIE